MIGIGNVGQRRISRGVLVAGRKFAARRHHRLRGVVADRARAPGKVQLQPELVKRQRPQRTADGAEAMKVTVADAAPVVELNAELDRALRTLDELGFVDA